LLTDQQQILAKLRAVVRSVLRKRPSQLKRPQVLLGPFLD